MAEEYKYEAYVPKKIVIGISDNGIGFPTMKDKDGKWKNVSVFENICGFKPHKQLDAKKEINKVLTQQVQVIDNVPTSGFKLEYVHKNVYNNLTTLYDDFSCVTLRDPRGWSFSINSAVFQKILEHNGFNLENGELVGIKLMYSWSAKWGGTPFSVIVADEHAIEMQNATDELVTARDTVESIKPAKLEIGKVYSSATSKLAGNKYMYLGKHDVYSEALHLKAVMRGNYSDMQEFIEDRQDITGQSRYVFYCIDIRKDGSWSVYNNIPGFSPYYVTTNVSKMFDTVEDVDLSNYFMYNDSSKNVSLEAVQQDMKRSALFNLIDFSKAIKTYASSKPLEDIFTHSYSDKDYDKALKTFPFHDLGSGIQLFTDNGYYTAAVDDFWSCRSRTEIEHEFKDFSMSICDEKIQVSTYRMNKDYDSYRRHKVYKTYAYVKNNSESKHQAFMQMFNELRPQIMQYIFCNGELVPPYQNLIINTRTYYRDIPVEQTNKVIR